MYMFDGMLMRYVFLSHLIVDVSLLVVDLHSGSIEYIFGIDLHTTVECHYILLAWMHYF